MRLNTVDLIDTLDEDVDVYSILHSLDDETTKELRFIATAFARFYISKSKGKSLREVLAMFDLTLETISLGIMGTSFKTSAPNMYKDLPTIKEGLDEEIKEYEKELKELRNKVKSIPSYEKKIKDLKEEINDLKDEIKLLKNKSKTSSSSGYSSYGGCGGSTVSYGRC